MSILSSPQKSGMWTSCAISKVTQRKNPFSVITGGRHTFEHWLCSLFLGTVRADFYSQQMIKLCFCFAYTSVQFQISVPLPTALSSSGKWINNVFLIAPGRKYDIIQWDGKIGQIAMCRCLEYCNYLILMLRRLCTCFLFFSALENIA